MLYRKKNSFFKNLIKNRVFLFMILPAVIYTLVFSYYPMSGIILAFKKYNYQDGVFGSPWNGIENFRFFFQSGQAARVTRNTVLYNIAFIVINLVIELTLAVSMTEIKRKRFISVSQTMLFLPYFISWVIVGVMSFNFFSGDYGFVNRILVALGGDKFPFYSTAEVWPPIIVMFNMWKNVGYGSIIYMAAITGIDTSIYEAAEIDGANVFQRIFKITIPSILPTIIIMLLLSVGGIFKGNFDLFYNIIGNNGLLFSHTDVIDTLTFRSLISSSNHGMSAAIGLYQSVLGLITMLVANGLVRRYQKGSELF